MMNPKMNPMMIPMPVSWMNVIWGYIGCAYMAMLEEGSDHSIEDDQDDDTHEDQGEWLCAFCQNHGVVIYYLLGCRCVENSIKGQKGITLRQILWLGKYESFLEKRVLFGEGDLRFDVSQTFSNAWAVFYLHNNLLFIQSFQKIQSRRHQAAECHEDRVKFLVVSKLQRTC